MSSRPSSRAVASLRRCVAAGGDGQGLRRREVWVQGHLALVLRETRWSHPSGWVGVPWLCVLAVGAQGLKAELIARLQEAMTAAGEGAGEEAAAGDDAGAQEEATDAPGAEGAANGGDDLHMADQVRPAPGGRERRPLTMQTHARCQAHQQWPSRVHL